ncbi:MAG: 4'-phosphopantetheinyl transferase superfamily protein [Lentisphaerae bacterium]|nr:4'-phosphopantetheinyl transferase superfamily protein [Lentisphaerota bacterium]
MIRRLAAPSLFSDVVSHVAVAFDLCFTDEAAAQGLELPSTLRAAVPKRQAEFLAGRYAACEALRGLGIADAAAPAMAGDRRPVWPEGVVGSITHTEGLAWAAVARRGDRRGLGIDSETIPPLRTAEEIHSVVLNEEESALLQASIVPHWGGPTAVCLALSAKESIYKSLSGSVETHLGFSDAILVAVDGTVGHLRFRLSRALSADLPMGQSCMVRCEITPRCVHTAMEWSRRSAPEE